MKHVLALNCLLFLTSLGYARSTWCTKNVTKSVSIVTQERTERHVDCIDLYKYLSQGWRYDSSQMHSVHGGSERVSMYFDTEDHMAECIVYKPEQTMLENITEETLVCCDGWFGNQCQYESLVLGSCHSNENCTSVFIGQMSVNECCVTMKGKSWNSPHGNKCEACARNNMPKQRTVQSQLSCATFGGRYVLGFHGNVAKLEQACASYNLLSSNAFMWYVNIYVSESCATSTEACRIKLQLEFERNQLVLQSNNGKIEFILNGQGVKLQRKSALFKGVFVRTFGNKVLIETHFGLKLTWDGLLNIHMFVEDLNSVDGLCKSLGDTYTTQGLGPADEFGCVSVTEFAEHELAVEVEDKLAHQCKQIETKTRTLTSCFGDPSLRISVEVCKDMARRHENKNVNNIQKTVVCEIVKLMATQCSGDWGTNENDWVESFNCKETCPKGMSYTLCEGDCQPTCSLSSSCGSDVCIPGCKCNMGTVLHIQQDGGWLCIPQQSCPCLHQGQEFVRGATVQQNCNLCTCQEGGQWQCTEDPCEATCKISSAVYLKTFDGTRINISGGKCIKHALATMAEPRNIEISAHIIPSQFGSIVSSTIVSGLTPSYTLPSIMTIHMIVDQTNLKFTKDFQLLVDATETKLPYRKNGVTIKMVSDLAIVAFVSNISLIWIPSNEELHITAKPALHDKLKGLCGSYNWNSKDDLVSPDGDIESNVAMFSQRYKYNADGSRCTDTKQVNIDEGEILAPSTFSYHSLCSTFSQRQEYAQSICNLMTSTVFEGCSSKVDVTYYMTMCINDLCASEEKQAPCRSLGAFAHACAASSNSSEILDWRNHPSLEGSCNVCPFGLIPTDCILPSDHMCRDTSISETSHTRSCAPACICPGGLYLDTRMNKGIRSAMVNDFKCVEKNSCSCEENGKNYPALSVVESGCSECTCSYGKWNCTPTVCDVTIKCPANLVRKEGMSDCDAITCDDIRYGNGLGHCDDTIKYEGCACPSGMVLMNEKCVLPSHCPCLHNGKLYQAKSTIQRDCNTCTCSSSQWTCTSHACTGTCVATGDPHYITFDGTMFSIEGVCKYTLVQHKRGLFSVQVENIPCGTTAVTCTKSVYVFLGNTRIHLSRGRSVSINGSPIVQFPRQYGNTLDSNHLFKVYAAGLFIIVSSPVLGISVAWDGGTRVYIDLSSDLQNSVEGLCGNFNGRGDDDFTTKHGSLEISPKYFADDWRVQTNCPPTVDTTFNNTNNPCLLNPHREAWARRKCGVIVHDSMFETCRGQVDYLPFYDWCVHDTCSCDSGGDCECLCTSIATFAKECSRQGIHVRWRSQDLCPMQCDNGLEYMSCGPVCQQTCAGEDLHEHCDTFPCMEGCFCPPDLLLHDGECIPRDECPCHLAQIAGVAGEMPPGTHVTMNCQNCTCVFGDWSCNGEACGNTTSCEDGQFSCMNGDCIPDDWVCDSEVDCADRSDELDCDTACNEIQFSCEGGMCNDSKSYCNDVKNCDNNIEESKCNESLSHCSVDEFQCSNGRCVSNSLVCDGRFDCGYMDYSDENMCLKDCPAPHYVPCGSGECIERVKLCNGVQDCTDNTDEAECVCLPEHFTCADTACIDRKTLCDGVQDCSSGEDEYNCPGEDKNIQAEDPNTLDSSSSTSCQENYFACTDQHECVPKEHVCNGLIDCVDASDEDGCDAVKPPMPILKNDTDCIEFSCDNDATKCIRWREVCDKHTHCSDHSDESVHCWKDCPEGNFHCDAGVRCLPKILVCDGQIHCSDKSDESEETCANITKNCDGFQCSDGSCINGSMICDGQNDCAKADDEENCEEITLPSGSKHKQCREFTCQDGTCVEYNKVCNGIFDCKEKEDEKSCATWSTWSQWGACSHSCGSGVKSRSRVCSAGDIPTDAVKQTCRGPSISERPCFKAVCYDEDFCKNNPDDPNCSSFTTLSQSTTSKPLVCSWAEWSDWGPCFGPCGVNGVQWAFRSPKYPNMQYRGRNRCSGPNRKSQRCPTKECVTCEINTNGVTLIKHFGDLWHSDPCHVCTCEEESKVNCKRLCKESCNKNEHLVVPHDMDACCYCVDETLYNATMTTVSPYLVNEALLEFSTSTPDIICGKDEYLCVADQICVSSTHLCDGINHCSSGEDEENCSGNKCGYSSWSSWSSCSSSCGIGRSNSIRKQLQQGVKCDGPFQIYRPCFQTACPVDGMWADWTSWTECSKSCGGGMQTRMRDCNVPRPQNGGIKCTGRSMQTRICSPAPCIPALCFGGTVYTNTSVCASGVSLCQQTCADLSSEVACKSSCSRDGCYCPKNAYMQNGNCVPKEKCSCTYNGLEYLPYSEFISNGCKCLCKDGVVTCETNCSVNCGWSAWSLWSACDRTCGYDSRQYRYRSPNNPLANGPDGVACKGENYQVRTCTSSASNQPCPAEWGAWQQWSSCSTSCGQGTKYRMRKCHVSDNDASLDYCSPGNCTEVSKCVEDNEACPHDTETCGQDMVWECTRKPVSCMELSLKSEIRSHNLTNCTQQCKCSLKDHYVQNGQCVHVSNCDCFAITKESPMPSLQLIKSGGKFSSDICTKCSCVSATISCHTNTTCQSIHYNSYHWTQWSDWSQCDRTCIASDKFSQPIFGQCIRKRQCIAYQGAKVVSGYCNGAAIEKRRCGEIVCPRQMVWSSWQPWSTCDVTCGNGFQLRRRNCSTFDGTETFNSEEYCYGRTIEVKHCSMAPCNGKQCPLGSHIEESCDEIDDCQPYTCLDLSKQYNNEDCKTRTSGGECTTKLSTCQCNTGLLWQDNKCVPKNQCNCLFKGALKRPHEIFNLGKCFFCECDEGEIECSKSSNFTQHCTEREICPLLTSVTELWSSWSSCSSTCGVGSRQRVRRIRPVSTLKKIFNEFCKTQDIEMEDCAITHCIKSCENRIDCYVDNSTTWSDWTSWGECSGKCAEEGWRHRYRFCIAQNKTKCHGDDIESTSCTNEACKEHPSWGEWSSWSHCSASCLNAAQIPIRRRTRVCKNNRNTEAQCPGASTAVETCSNVQLCKKSSVKPTQCSSVITGSVYSTCGPKCPRSCADLQYCLHNCIEGCYCPEGYVINHNNTACIKPMDCGCYQDTMHYDIGQTFKTYDSGCENICTCTQSGISCKKSSNCSIIGAWCGWSHWSGCTRNCGHQNRTRLRSCGCPPPSDSSNTSLSCPGTNEVSATDISVTLVDIDIFTEKQTKSCRIPLNCPSSILENSWSSWSSWSSCTCDSVFKNRTRDCLSKYDCLGLNIEITPCRFDPLVCGWECPLGLTLQPCNRTNNGTKNNCLKTCMKIKNGLSCNDEDGYEEDDILQERQNKCIPHCGCPDGLYFDPSNITGEICVRAEQCPCYDISNDSHGNNFDLQQFAVAVKINETLISECKQCTCSENSSLQCIETCKNKEEEDGSVWGDWSPWSKCSASCDGGTKWRARTCLFESDCEGDRVQETSCNTVPCGVGSWEKWSDCSSSCGGGVKVRTRKCLDIDGNCDDKLLKQIIKCNESPCYPSYSPWSHWTTCNVECGSGQRTRSKTCRNQTNVFDRSACGEKENPTYAYNLLPFGGPGEEITDENSIVLEIRKCTAKKSCPMNLTTVLPVETTTAVQNTTPSIGENTVDIVLNWEQWSSWSQCSARCGGGSQTRTRKCKQQSDFGTHLTGMKRVLGCKGAQQEDRVCNMIKCARNKTCPTGLVLKHCSELCGGDDDDIMIKQPTSCQDVAEKIVDRCSNHSCNEEVCVCPHGKYLQIASNLHCVEPSHCDCVDESGAIWPPLSSWIVKDKIGCKQTCSCKDGVINCTKDCNFCTFTQWSAWTQCNETCKESANASKFRYRGVTPIVEEINSNHTVPCDSEAEVHSKPCENLLPCTCPENKKHGEKWTENECYECICNHTSAVCNNTCWSEWSTWGECSTSCSGGNQQRIRVCSRKDLCFNAKDVERRKCNEQVSCGEELTTGCMLVKQSENLYVDDCVAKNVSVNNCIGGCPSNVKVTGTAPYIESHCTCCNYELDVIQPYINVTLHCREGRRKTIAVPNIGKCSCSECDAGLI